MTARRARSTVTGFGLLAGACLVALLGAPPAGATDGGLPDAMPGDRILVSHRADDAVELHVVDPDSGERTVLTSGETDTGGTWSPDGRHVAFLRVEAGGDGLWVVPVAGGPARRLADGGRSPSWSPDGTRIVHSPSTEATPLPLAITDLAGATTPVPGTAGGIEPAWSPSGDEIAYVDPARDRALVLVRTDGTDRTVTPGPASGPVWSPDADRVAYVERTDDGDRLRMIDGAASASYAYRNPFTRIQRLDYSPDGSAVAVTAARDGEPLRVWTVRVSDGIVRQVGEDDRGEDRSPSWSASAGRIAFSRTADASAADQPSDVLVIPATGGAARQVTDSGRDLTADFGPGLALRRSGRSRIATAAALAGTLPAAEAIVVARADAYPDALAGGPLAAALGAPILLTGSDGLDPILPAEIDRLGARTAYLLGGTGALSAAVADDLRAAGIDDVQRLSGADRFGTAAAIADALEALTGPAGRVLVVEGGNADPARGWPDALSAAGLAGVTGDPILLVERDLLPAATRTALAARDAATATIVGGSAAVSEAVADAVAAEVARVERVAGADRYATSARLADLAVAAGGDAALPWLATGRNWPDGLAAAAAAAADGGVLLLVDGTDPTGSPASSAWLAARPARRAVLVGGRAAITSPAATALEGALAAGG